MFGLKGFTTDKPRSFNYTPRYWDKEAAEREDRKRKILGDKYDPESTEHQPGSLIRESRLRRMQHADRTHSRSRSAIIRAVLFLAMAMILIFVLTDYFGKM